MPQLRHLGRQLLVLALKQKLQNTIVLLEKKNIPIWRGGGWQELVQSSRNYLCAKGTHKAQNTAFIKSTNN